MTGLRTRSSSRGDDDVVTTRSGSTSGSTSHRCIAMVGILVWVLLLQTPSTGTASAAPSPHGGGGCSHDMAAAERVSHLGKGMRPIVTAEDDDDEEYRSSIDDHWSLTLIRRRSDDDDDDDDDASNETAAPLDPSTLPPLRFFVSTLDVDAPSRHCTQAGQWRPSLLGSTVQCRQKNVLTPAKRALLIDRVLPRALHRLSSKMKAPPLINNRTAIGVSRGACPSFSKLPSYASPGISNADFVLLVGASPIANGALAWGLTCAVEGRTFLGRPLVGMINFDPGALTFETDVPPTQASVDNATELELEPLVDVATHEILHALGISHELFRLQNRTNTTVRRGKNVTELISPHAIAAVRNYTACATLTGVELEDEGAVGSSLSHVERRLYREEVMVAALGDGRAGEGALSVITLGILSDLGFIVNMSEAEPMRVGRGLGCSFHTERCDTPAGRGGYFCTVPEDSSSDSQSPPQCSFDRRRIARCLTVTSSVDLPSYFQYFPDDPRRRGHNNFVDACPEVALTVLDCFGDPASLADTDEAQWGHVRGTASRCVVTSESLVNASANVTTLTPTETAGYRCLNLRCVAPSTTDNDRRVQLAGPDGAWVDCDQQGAETNLTLPGYSGWVVCPAAATVCDDARLAYPVSDGSDDDAYAYTPVPTFDAAFAQSYANIPPPAPSTATNTLSGRSVLLLCLLALAVGIGLM